MPTDSEQHTAFIALAKHAFAEQAFKPNDAILMAAAKNLARLQTPTSTFTDLTPNVCFNESLKWLAHV
ncbi:MAG: hypothetical protein EXR25_12820 [Limnohabitans sp.]|nr:hypothetical protein [Limnohabitans sp.]